MESRSACPDSPAGFAGGLFVVSRGAFDRFALSRVDFPAACCAESGAFLRGAVSDEDCAEIVEAVATIRAQDANVVRSAERVMSRGKLAECVREPEGPRHAERALLRG